MAKSETPTAVVAGLGPGLGEALCRRLVGAGYRVAGLARDLSTAGRLKQALNRKDRVFVGRACDVTDPSSVTDAVAQIKRELGDISVYIHNAAHLLLKPFIETTPAEFEALWRVTCLGAVNGAHAVLPSMLRAGRGSLLFLGATASVKGGPQSAAFSSAKFALRGLAQSLARAYGPEGIHIAHLVIDGVIWGDRARARFRMSDDQCLAPMAVAETCLQLIGQDRSAWTQELNLRPDVEKF